MDVVTKSAQADVIALDSEHPNGEFEVILSTDSLDRDGECLYVDEWKQPLPDRIHIDSDHGMSVEKTVGSAVPRIEGNRMIGKGSFAGTPHGQTVRQLVSEGHITTMSVTFAERKSQKDAKPQRELLNAAFVAVPANPEAVVLSSKASKSAGTIYVDVVPRIAKLKAGMDASGDNPTPPAHDDMVQAVHDAACALGAQCLNEVEADPGVDEGANKSLDPESSDTKSVGQPPESADESPAEIATKAATQAPADAPTQAADQSADDAVKERLSLKARALLHLVTKNIERNDDDA